ncbi:hypothetical protein GWK47_001894 [Chionoecetes opilio]|uniref:Uncharacterized protein n=1 Tax=Chionoecetes opilio TaxID=41210 RepID=A0A8J5CK69_CHIOP|nr:hypothetical protein GWK47_001894 [Chionoecetes opilio]
MPPRLGTSCWAGTHQRNGSSVVRAVVPGCLPRCCTSWRYCCPAATDVSASGQYLAPMDAGFIRQSRPSLDVLVASRTASSAPPRCTEDYVGWAPCEPYAAPLRGEALDWCPEWRWRAARCSIGCAGLP